MDERPVRTLPGLRFTCRGCADCCSSGFEIGPVEPEVVADLIDSGIATLWPPAAQGWATQRATPDGQKHVYFQQRNGRCVFLRDDDLCAIHNLLGPHRKPGFCREFPYHVVEEPRGWVAVTRPSCGGLHRSHADGDLVGDEDLAELRDLSRVVHRRRFAPAEVEALPGIRVPLAQWLAWEDDLLATLEAHPAADPEQALTLVRARLQELSGAPPLPAVPGIARHATTTVLTTLEKVMGAVLAQGQGGPPDRIAFAKEAAHRMTVAREGLLDAPPTTPETDAYLHMLLRSQILAKQWEAWGSVHAGLGQYQLGLVVARAQAFAGDPEAFAEPYKHWLRFSANAMIGHVLRTAKAALTDIFLHTHRAT